MTQPTRDAIVATIEAYCRAETDKDREGFMALFAPDIVHEDPVGTAPRRGLAELDALWDMIVAYDATPWLTDEVIVCGAEAVALMACDTGPPDARVRNAPIVDHFTFAADGKIVGVRAFYNWPSA